MQRSEQIDEVIKARVAFQAENIQIGKDAQGHGYKYATYPQILNITREPLTKHGLTVVQLAVSQGEKIGVESYLMHVSGQWIGEVIYSDVERQKTKDGKNKLNLLQEVGSAITFLKRYGFCAITGIEPDKDMDGSHDVIDMATGEVVKEEKVFTPSQRLIRLLGEKNVQGDEIAGWCERGGVTNVADLKLETTLALIARLEAR